MTSPDGAEGGPSRNAVVDCGWGRLLFGHTFATLQELADELGSEAEGRRDICFMARDPHVLVSLAPERLFIDPSNTFRLDLATAPPFTDDHVTVREATDERDVDAINRLYAACGMVTAPPAAILDAADDDVRHCLVAQDEDGRILGTVMGVDHVAAFDDPDNGSSLWCLAVDPQATRPGIGEALVRALASRFEKDGRAHMDLSVLHDNAPAIALYRKLGFQRVELFAVKTKNPINERFFVAAPVADGLDALNPYARIVADEALRRGIAVDIVDSTAGYLRLTHGGRSVLTRESLSELTTAVAMSRCDDKRVTRDLLESHGLLVPQGREATFDDQDLAFLEQVGEVVVKPARGEQGEGITVGVRTEAELIAALTRARNFCPIVLLEQRVEGHDLRVIVIGDEVVAAAERRPAQVIGTGTRTIRALIEAQSRRRAAATGGESRIPMDEETESNVRYAGWELDDVLPDGEVLRVRGTANLHTGGTMHDVTDLLHPAIVDAAVAASRALDIPVVGLDFLVPDLSGDEYVIIEANERPGLANHEPQPTAEKFVDLLFPGTRGLPSAWDPSMTGRGEDHRP